MESQQNIPKGDLMEELLRNYFLNMGYYVVRGVKYKYEEQDITDVDLYLYGRFSSLTRQRINVDIKNKKSPQAFERILWANGLRLLLSFDSCIVATTDQRSVIHSFGQLHDTTVLDGTFLTKLKSNSNLDRLTEEALLSKLSKHNSPFSNKDWRSIYELSKSRLLTELDFSGFNANLNILNFFIEKSITDEQRRGDATRMLYLILSHLLIIVDYIIKDIAFLDLSIREKKLSDGLKFGNLGKEGVDKIISIAVQISGNKQASSLLRSLDSIPTDILTDFFSKNENSKNLFSWARDFESLAYKKIISNPVDIAPPLKGAISVFLDFFGIERKKFFGAYPKSTQITMPIVEQMKDINDDKDK